MGMELNRVFKRLRDLFSILASEALSRRRSISRAAPMTSHRAWLWSALVGPEISKQPHRSPNGVKMGAAEQPQDWWLLQKCSTPMTWAGVPSLMDRLMALVPTLSSDHTAPGPKCRRSASSRTSLLPQVRKMRPSASATVMSRPLCFI